MKLYVPSQPALAPFDVPNPLGLALIAIGGGKVEQWVPNFDTQCKPLPVHWQIFGSADDLSQTPLIKGECPNCSQGIEMYKVANFRHCNPPVNEAPPERLAKQLNALIRLRNKTAIAREEERQKPKEVTSFHWI